VFIYFLFLFICLFIFALKIVVFRLTAARLRTELLVVTGPSCFLLESWSNWDCCQELRLELEGHGDPGIEP
jgi:hypothetical protein